MKAAFRLRIASVATGQGPTRRRKVCFHCIRRGMPAYLLIVCCLCARSIDCQKAWEHIPGDGSLVEAADQNFPRVAFRSNGMLISNREGSSQVKVQGYLQADGRLFAANLNGLQHDQLLFRRVRPLVEGTLADQMYFRFMPDFGEGNTVIQEVYAESTSLPFGNLRLGKFKTPIGLEVLRPDRDLTFAERSMASDLLPLRDLGSQFEGSFLGDAITYELGYFSGTEDGANANFEWHGTNEGVARVFVEPFTGAGITSLQPLGVGVAASAGHHFGDPPVFRTIGQEILFHYAAGTIADGMHKRVSPQASYFFGPVGVLAEYVVSGATLSAGGVHQYLSHHGWELAGSVMLTGENNTYSDFRPRHDFAPAEDLHHWGAWELAVRHSGLDFDANAFPNFASPASSAKRASESAVGMNWHMNRHTKLIVDYEYTSFHMAAGNIPRIHSERVAMTRIQLGF